MNVFNAIPVTDKYKVAHPEAVVLLAQPNTIRLCVFLEAAVAATIFALSYYYSATTGTVVTKVTYEVLGGSYSCSVLAPRTDTDALSSTTSELIAFSSPEYDYVECMGALGSSGYDMCNHREDYVLSLTGVTSDDSSCEDLFLSDGYRFCKGGEVYSEIDTTTETSSSVFATQSDSTYSLVYDNIYYFTNASGSLINVSLPVSSSYIISDFVSDGESTVYMVIKRDAPILYAISPNRSSAVPLTDLPFSVNSGIFGITYGENCVFVYVVGSSDKKAKILKYNTTSRMASTVNAAVDCSSYYGASTPTGGVDVRYISVGCDGNLYALCLGSKVRVMINSTAKIVFPIFQINSSTLSLTRTLYVENSSLILDGSKAVESISQVLQVGNNGKFEIYAQNYLFVGNLSGSSNFLSSVSLKERVTADYALKRSDDEIYFVNGAHHSYHVSSDSFTTYAANFMGEYYLSTRLQLAFTYQICDGVYSNYTIDSSVSTTFSGQCDEVNGIYYQDNEHFSVPSSCQGYIDTKDNATELLSCEGVASLYDTFTTTTCEESYSVVCEAAFTNNPPFSCEKTTYPSWITNLATAFANGSGVTSIVFILIKLILRQIYKHYVYDFDYDKKSERYLNKNQEKVFAKDVEAGQSGNVENRRSQWKKELERDTLGVVDDIEAIPLPLDSGDRASYKH
eukprot:gene3631-3976_t